MWERIVTTLGRGTEAVLAPVADLIEPVGGTWAWGWAVIVVGAAWRLATWPLLVAATADRLAWQRQTNAGQEPHPPDRGPAHLRLRRAATLLQVLLLVVIAVWSRTGPSADEARFAGLDPLASSAVASGAAGVAWALALTLAATAGVRLAQRAVPPADERQAFFTRYLMPGIFCCLGLFLPAAVVLPFTASMLLSLVVTARAARTEPVREAVLV